MEQLKGIHHVTAITSSAEKIYDYFTDILGLKLVKKTINQDDIHTYHLFFADDAGNPGTDMTFFDFRGIPKGQKGTDEISRTGFRVPSDQALDYWMKRFEHYNVTHEGIATLFGRKAIFFKDFDDQAYALFSDENVPGVDSGEPFKKGPVPSEYAITGLGPIFLTVSDHAKMDTALTKHMGMRLKKHQGDAFLYEMGAGGNGASVIVHENDNLNHGIQGYGSIHHVAFRIEDRKALDEWTEHLNKLRKPTSGFVDRFYFKSLYTRLYPGILFEFATEGPGFIDDEEDRETLGTTLALPPAFRDKRETIERIVRHFDTTRHVKTREKEYFDE